MSVYISVELQEKIRHRFADCCAYCRTAEYLTVTTFEFEHIIPRSAGGETVSENLCLACPSCNRYKATRQTAIDPNTQEEVKLFHPQKQTWIEHFAWNENATEIVGLTAVGKATISALKMNGEHPPNI
ncbi:MAG: HNH endonuclease [Sphaerospermopsis kisseleviana]